MGESVKDEAGSDPDFDMDGLFAEEELGKNAASALAGEDGPGEDYSGGVKDLFSSERETKRKKGQRTDKNKKRRREQKSKAASISSSKSGNSLSSDDGDGLPDGPDPVNPVPPGASAASEDKKNKNSQNRCTCSCCGITSTEAGSCFWIFADG